MPRRRHTSCALTFYALAATCLCGEAGARSMFTAVSSAGALPQPLPTSLLSSLPSGGVDGLQASEGLSGRTLPTSRLLLPAAACYYRQSLPTVAARRLYYIDNVISLSRSVCGKGAGLLPSALYFRRAPHRKNKQSVCERLARWAGAAGDATLALARIEHVKTTYLRLRAGIIRLLRSEQRTGATQAT